MTATATIQASSTGNNLQRAKPFPFRPMLSISGARSSLPGLGEDEIIRLIDTGDLEVAFNIGADEHARAREVRILPACIEHYQANVGKTFLNWEWPRIAQEILNGYGLDWISGVDLRLLLNCSTESIGRLIQRNQLALAPGSSCRPGPKGSPRIMVASFLEFLKKRRAL